MNAPYRIASLYKSDITGFVKYVPLTFPGARPGKKRISSQMVTLDIEMAPCVTGRAMHSTNSPKHGNDGRLTCIDRARTLEIFSVLNYAANAQQTPYATNSPLLL
jgi:hypothetical protein